MTALEQGVVGRDAEHAQHLNSVLTQQQSGTSLNKTLHSTKFSPAERRLYSRSGPCEVVAQVKEFDGDDDQLLEECQQDIESGQPREVGQEVKRLCCGVASSVFTSKSRMLYHGPPKPVECR